MLVRIQRSIGENMVEYNVAAQIKVYVDDPSALDNVKGEVGKLAKVQNAKEEDVGFGIKALMLTVLFDDSQGGIEQLEEKIKAIEHVSQTEVIGVNRI
jgi:translation elongation factor EF-1beta